MGFRRWYPDLLVNDPNPEEEPDSNEDPDLSCDLVVQTFKIIHFCLIPRFKSRAGSWDSWIPLFGIRPASTPDVPVVKNVSKNRFRRPGGPRRRLRAQNAIRLFPSFLGEHREWKGRRTKISLNITRRTREPWIKTVSRDELVITSRSIRKSTQLF